jgi:hypothetical protein
METRIHASSEKAATQNISRKNLYLEHRFNIFIKHQELKSRRAPKIL